MWMYFFKNKKGCWSGLATNDYSWCCPWTYEVTSTDYRQPINCMAGGRAAPAGDKTPLDTWKARGGGKERQIEEELSYLFNQINGSFFI